MGIAGSFELTARNKYSALLVNRPEQLAPYLASFAVVFNVGKLVGPPVGGWLVALTGPATALAIDATSYLFPIASVIWLLRPNLEQERRSTGGSAGSLWAAWRECGMVLRHVFRFTALACFVGFFHPGLAPYIASEVIGPSPQALGLFTSVLAAGSIAGGLALRRNSNALAERPGWLMGSCVVVTAAAQIGMAGSFGVWWRLAMSFLIGAGTACLLSGVNLMSQIGSPMELRGRMAALGQISFLGSGGFSGLVAALMAGRIGLMATFLMLGSAGFCLGLLELSRWRALRLRSGGYP
jgi:MFS family permease